MATMHPTKALLLETAVQLIDRSGPQGFTVEELLEVSGISKGSMYHHFEDFNDVIESAQLARYSRFVDQDSASIARAMAQVKSQDEMFQVFRLITDMTASPERAASRLDRAAILGQARHSPKFAALLAVEQERLTTSLADVVRELQERGFVSADGNPRALAAFVQAYAFGRAIDEQSEHPLDVETWVSLVDKVLRALV